MIDVRIWSILLQKCRALGDKDNSKIWQHIQTGQANHTVQHRQSALVSLRRIHPRKGSRICKDNLPEHPRNIIDLHLTHAPQRIQYYDSMNGQGLKFMNGLRRFLQSMAKLYLTQNTASDTRHLLNFHEWRIQGTVTTDPDIN